ncbi:MAG: hypothetical protein KZQ96_23470 [Candidatus Thiodiazotropha sp. (ex Lucinoma borealis)]|nr:hypothetical protein [Candidatus Thiodiazotropha sp. (ex Lucinoma borealis)]
MDMTLNTKHIKLLSSLNIASFLTMALVACGGGGGGTDGSTDGSTDVSTVDSTVGDINSDTDFSSTSENYVTTAAMVYFTQASLGGIYAVKPLFSKLVLYYEESGQKVTACDNSGEKNINVQKSRPENSLNPGDNMTVTYLHCNDGEGAQEGTLSIDIIENSEVSNSDFRTILDSVSNKILDGATIIGNMRIKQEELSEANVIGINSDRYETDGAFKGNPNTTEHPAPHYEDDKYRFSKMIFEKYQDDSTNDTYLYWDIDFHDKDNTAFSYATTVLDDVKIINSALSSGKYSVLSQGDRIEVTIAGTDNIHVILDKNNDGSVEEQQQMTSNQFFAAGFVVTQ